MRNYREGKRMSSYSPPGIDPKSKLGKSRNINPKFKKKNAKKRER